MNASKTEVIATNSDLVNKDNFTNGEVVPFNGLLRPIDQNRARVGKNLQRWSINRGCVKPIELFAGTNIILWRKYYV